MISTAVRMSSILAQHVLTQALLGINDCPEHCWPFLAKTCQEWPTDLFLNPPALLGVVTPRNMYIKT